MLPVVLGLLGAASPFILDHIQASRARIAAAAAHRESELDTAKELFDIANTSMDRLANLSKSTMFSIVFRDLSVSTVGDPPIIAPNGMPQPAQRPQPTSKGPTGEDVATYWTYKSELMKWQNATGTSYAQVTGYFGDESANTFRQIQIDLETLARQVEAAFYKRTDSVDYIGDFAVNNIVPPDATNDFRTKYFGIWNAMHQRITALSEDMIKAIQQEKVGSLGLPEKNEAQEELEKELKRLSPPKKSQKPIKPAKAA